MSFIQQTMRCKKCGDEFNVALGIFGYGMPEKCGECGAASSEFQVIATGWLAKSKNHEE
ncbi:MAG: hypothetical protein KGL39_14940 [Patescibacteria group bacterium]|nr:hypothetical protein [Patescibacteria group bacterium]